MDRPSAARRRIRQQPGETARHQSICNSISGAPRWIVLYVGVDRRGYWISLAEIAPVSPSASPDKTAVEPIVWPNVCGVTPSTSARATAFCQSCFVPDSIHRPSPPLAITLFRKPIFSSRAVFPVATPVTSLSICPAPTSETRLEPEVEQHGDKDERECRPSCAPSSVPLAKVGVESSNLFARFEFPRL